MISTYVCLLMFKSTVYPTGYNICANLFFLYGQRVTVLLFVAKNCFFLLLSCTSYVISWLMFITSIVIHFYHLFVCMAYFFICIFLNSSYIACPPLSVNNNKLSYIFVFVIVFSKYAECSYGLNLCYTLLHAVFNTPLCTFYMVFRCVKHCLYGLPLTYNKKIMKKFFHSYAVVHKHKVNRVFFKLSAHTLKYSKQNTAYFYQRSHKNS